MAADAGAAGEPTGTKGPWNGSHGDICGGFSSGIQGQGCSLGQGQGWGHRAGGGKAKDKEWIPVTMLGILVKDMKVKSLGEIFLFYLPIKESGWWIFFPESILQGWGFEDYVHVKADSCWSADQDQGICRHWEWQWTYGLGCYMP